MFDYLKKYIGWKCEFGVDIANFSSIVGELKDVNGSIAEVEVEEGFGKGKKKVAKLVNLHLIQVIKPVEQLNRYAK